MLNGSDSTVNTTNGLMSNMLIEIHKKHSKYGFLLFNLEI